MKLMLSTLNMCLGNGYCEPMMYVAVAVNVAGTILLNGWYGYRVSSCYLKKLTTNAETSRQAADE